jgi:hypothetical protein
MRNFARVGVVFGSVVGLSGVFAVVGVGCGGDDTAVTVDSSTDTTTPTPDGNNTIDVGTGETGEGGGTDSGDSGDGGFSFDGTVPPLDTYIQTVIAAFCDRFGECCLPGNPAAWDRQACITEQLTHSVIGDLAARIKATKDGGTGILYDTTKAAECLGRLQSPSGTPCTLPSANYVALRSVCYGALQGTVALNAKGCTDSIQCASAGRCDTSTDGGTCVALLDSGARCKTSDDCSYRGIYQPPLFCDDDPARHPDDAGGSIPTCSPQLPINATCFTASDFEGACASAVCSGVGTCEDSVVLNDVTDCQSFTIADAGTDG